jgi:hypothetical protein
MLTFKPLRFLLLKLMVLALFSNAAQAAFPDDFNGVVWLDPKEVASWPQTAVLDPVAHDSSALRIYSNKRSVWRRAMINGSDCCNASLWVFARFDNVWHAVTIEYMRFGQTHKGPYVVNGGQAKRAPFKVGSYEWTPNQGEVIAFMVSGVARFNLANNNVRERSNVYLYKWGVGPVTEIDDEGLEDDPQPPPPPSPEEECVEPEPENNTHVYTGAIDGFIDITTPETTIPFAFNEPTTITVKDDRSLVMTVDSEQMQSQVQSSGNFSGQFVLQEELLGEPCNVTINVFGNVNGKLISGVGNGAESCGVYSAVLRDANFIARSATEPSYLDERPPAPKLCAPILAPIHDLLLQ